MSVVNVFAGRPRHGLLLLLDETVMGILLVRTNNG